MCGVFGWSFSQDFRLPIDAQARLARSLAEGNLRRGTDSWGISIPGERVQVARGVGSIVPETYRMIAERTAMAHTRQATTGRVCAANSHPLRAGRVVLAHNGCVWNHSELNAIHGRRCNVDSEHFAHHLAEGRDFDDIRGYGTIEWMIDGEASVRLCRITENAALAVACIDWNDEKNRSEAVIWSSDPIHLAEALFAAGLSDRASKHVVDAGMVLRAENGTLYETSRRLAMAKDDAGSFDWRTYYRTQGRAEKARRKPTGNGKVRHWVRVGGELVETDVDLRPIETARERKARLREHETRQREYDDLFARLEREGDTQGSQIARDWHADGIDEMDEQDAWILFDNGYTPEQVAEELFLDQATVDRIFEEWTEPDELDMPDVPVLAAGGD